VETSSEGPAEAVHSSNASIPSQEAGVSHAEEHPSAGASSPSQHVIPTVQRVATPPEAGIEMSEHGPPASASLVEAQSIRLDSAPTQQITVILLSADDVKREGIKQRNSPSHRGSCNQNNR
jgi:hypothetical protein